MSNHHTDDSIKEESTCETGVATSVVVENGVVVASLTNHPLSSKNDNDDDVEAPEASDDNEHETLLDKDSPSTTTVPKKKMETFEIEDGGHPSLQNVPSEDSEDLHLSDDDGLDDDMEGLLQLPSSKGQKASKHKLKKTTTKPNKLLQTAKAASRVPGGCCAGQRIGNTTVFWPSMYHKTGWGMIGPHLFGPPAVMAILWSASFYFIKHAWHKVGWMTAAVCVGFTLVATYHFGNCAFRDPGIVRCDDNTLETNERPPPPDRHHRWCDVCRAYQPPSGAHCPDCNVCVVDFDHHCAWMGCCIGGRNYKPFMRFNMTWLLYLTYAVFWVSLLGPVLFRHHDDDNVSEESFQMDGAPPQSSGNASSLIDDNNPS